MSQPPAKPAGSSRRAKFDGSLPGVDAPSSSSSAPPPATTPQGPRRDKGKGRATAALSPGVVVAPPAPKLPPPAGQTATDDHAGNTAEDGICFICADEVTYWAVGECGHRTCHVCSIRLRALFKKTDCTFCKVSRAERQGSRLGVRGQLQLEEGT